MKSVYVEFKSRGFVSVKEEQVAVGNLEANEVLVRTEASVIGAGTECARLNGIDDGADFPHRPGLGAVGRILALGGEVEGFRVGQRVAYSRPHAHVQRFRHLPDDPWSHLFPTPSGMDPLHAALGSLAQVSLTAPLVSEVRIGDTIAVFGLGSIGLLAAMLYQMRGGRVIGLEPLPERAERARKAGIGTVIDAIPSRQVDALMELTAGRGADITVDAAGNVVAIGNAILCSAQEGQVVLLGTPRSALTADITPFFARMHQMGLVVRGAHAWRYPVRGDRGCPVSFERTFETVLDLIANQIIDPAALITHVITPEEAPATYEALCQSPDEFGTVVIDWRATTQANN